jgi:hypothetical protein
MYSLALQREPPDVLHGSFVGVLGNVLIAIYIVLVTFAPTVKDMAMAFAMPGGRRF